MTHKKKRKKQECPDKHKYTWTNYPAITRMLGKPVCKCGKVQDDPRD